MWLRTARTNAHVLGVAAALLLTLAVAGCGGGDDDGADVAADTTTSTSTSATPTSTPAVATSTPVDETTTTTTAPPTTAPVTTSPPETPPPETVLAATLIDAAVARCEEFMHAYGTGDVATYCDIALPGLTKYFGPLSADDCAGLVGGMVTESPDELASIAAATVDASQAVSTAPDRVEIPASSINYPTPVSDPGDVGELAVMGLIDGQWYVVDGV